MAQVKDGDVVRVHYTGKITNGEQFDSSTGREPLEFTVGAGQMIKGFDAAIPGMKVGEKKTINILPEDAYGVKDDVIVLDANHSLASKELVFDIELIVILK
jgi:peptidylprolyl isomerase